MILQLITLALSALGVVASSLAVIIAARTARSQADLTRLVHHDQMMLSQRQLFLDIWPRLVGLNEIDPAKPVGPDVINAVNVLELVALCWEGGMVDSGVIRRAFGEVFLRFYDNIMKVPNLGNPNKSGSDMIRENPSIGKLYKQLQEEAINRNALTPVGNAPQLTK